MAQNKSHMKRISTGVADMDKEEMKSLVVYIVVSLLLLLVTGYLFVVHVTQQSELARVIGLVLAFTALYVLGKWYPRP